MKIKPWFAAFALVLEAAGAERILAQQRSLVSADLEVVQIRPNFYLNAGAGANVAVQIGQDGVVIVDTGMSARADQVLAEIRKLTGQPIRYIINTSADPDHVGGNEKLSAAGQSIIPTGGLNDIASAGGRAVIFAEEHVLARIRSASFQFDPAGRVLPEPCEPQVEIPRKEGAVPHYLPNTNPFVDEMAKLYGIPLEAVRGGAMTMYPECRKKIKDAYKAPEKCAQDCGGPAAPPPASAPPTPAGAKPVLPTQAPNR